jgi:uncharacterized protein (UPF0332 family)
VTADSIHAEVSWRKAVAHLNEAAAQDADASPTAVIHSSYYAMFHAAPAVLFKATGDAPKRHDSIIRQFGLPARDLDEAMRASGWALNVAKDDRNAADYDEAVLSSPEDARGLARDFLAICDTRHAFGLSISGDFHKKICFVRLEFGIAFFIRPALRQK